MTRRPGHPIRCPRCKAAPVRYTEVLTVAWLLEQREDGSWFSGGDTNGHHGPPVTAYCTCGHEWTVRRAHDLWDVMDRQGIEITLEDPVGDLWVRPRSDENQP